MVIACVGGDFFDAFATAVISVTGDGHPGRCLNCREAIMIAIVKGVDSVRLGIAHGIVLIHAGGSATDCVQLIGRRNIVICYI